MHSSSSNIMRYAVCCLAFVATSSYDSVHGSPIMSDIVRVPITTAEGPAFILIGTNRNFNHSSLGTIQVPEGIVIVKEEENDIAVRFVPSETIPDMMKSLIVEKMKAINLKPDSEIAKDIVTNGVVNEPSTPVPLNEHPELIATTAMFTLSEEAAEGVNVEYGSRINGYAEDPEILAQQGGDRLTENVETSESGTVANGNVTSTLAPRSSKVESKGQKSGQLSERRDSAPSARNSRVLFPAMITSFACVFVSLSVGLW